MKQDLLATMSSAPAPVIPGSILSLDELGGPDRYRVECICRATANAVYLGGEMLLSRVLGRYKIFLDTRDRGFGSHVALDGYWEIWLTQFIARLIKPGMHVADIGANFGYYSLLMADLIGPAGRLLAVEPNPPVAALLKQTLELNGFMQRCTVVAAAAGAEEGEGHLLVPEGEPKNATLLGLPGSPRDAGVLVPIHSLDSLLHSFPLVHFLKIDAEGAEEDIVSGMGGLIERCRPRMILEFNPSRCRAPQDLLAQLRRSYPVVQCLDYEARVTAVTDETLLDPTNHEDWLLFLGNET